MFSLLNFYGWELRNQRMSVQQIESEVKSAEGSAIARIAEAWT